MVNSSLVDAALLKKELMVRFSLNMGHCKIYPYRSGESWTILITDPVVCLADIRKFASEFAGSVMVKAHMNVDLAHAQPHKEEIRMAVKRLHCFGVGLMLQNGSLLYRNSTGFYVTRNLACYPTIDEKLVLHGHPWAIQALALQVARIMDYTRLGILAKPDYLEDALTPDWMKVTWRE